MTSELAHVESETAGEPEGPEDDNQLGRNLVPEAPAWSGRPWRAALAGALIVALAAGGGGWWWLQHNQPAPAPAAPVAAAAEDGLFLSVTAPGDKVVDGVYFADGATPTAVYLPGSLILDVPTLGTVPLADSLKAGVDVPGVAFADATGFKVTQNWALPMDAMAKLVDKVGGVTVTVDVPVTANGLNLTPGEQKLDGKAALTFATWTATGEAASAQLNRLSAVTEALLKAMPTEQAAVEALLASVPGKTTQKPAELAAAILEVRADLTDADYASMLLPTTESPTAQVPDGVTVDQAGLAVVGDRVGNLQAFAPGSAGKVSLQNATGVAGADLGARRELVDAGFSYTWAGLAQPAQATTIVLVPFGGQTKGAEVAKTLKLQAAQVVESTIVPSGQDALVLLGADFRPDQASASASASASSSPSSSASASGAATASPSAGASPSTSAGPSASASAQPTK